MTVRSFLATLGGGLVGVGLSAFYGSVAGAAIMGTYATIRRRNKEPIGDNEQQTP